MGSSVSIVDGSPVCVANPNQDAQLFLGLLNPDNNLGNIGAAGVGNALPQAANAVPGAGGVDTGVALEILNNMAQGKPPFKPELGRVGGVSWFVLIST